MKVEVIPLDTDIRLTLIVDYDILTGENCGYSLMLRDMDVTDFITGKLQEAIEAEAETLVASRKYGIE